MRHIAVDIGRLRADLDALAGFGRTPAGGVDRRTFSPAFQEAQDWLIERMRAAGLAARRDAAGNAIGRIGPQGPAVLAGSHIDSVPDGGRFDGALGVLAALEAARAMQEAGRPLRRALEVVAFADEEGSYLSLLGSRAMTGALAPDEMRAAHSAEGEPLAQAMARVGLDAERIAAAARPREAFAGYFELHVEQGPVLERRGVPIGVVEAIVGLDHADVRFLGEPAHAGTTPMDMRRDAVRGAAVYASRAFETVRRHGGADTRLTFGIVEAKPQVTNVVPYEARLRQEIRDPSAERLQALRRQMRDLARAVAAEENLQARYEDVSHSPPARMAEAARRRIEAACDALGLERLAMPSGAGHDAQAMAAVCEAGLLFVPSVGGHSHRPDELTRDEDVRRGAEVLARVVADACGGDGA